MKTIRLLTGLVTLLFLAACTTTQQRTAFNTIGTLEATATGAVDGYFLLVAQDRVPTNAVPDVSRNFNRFQGGVLVALDLVQNNTNALAPASLQQLSDDLLNVIRREEAK